MSEFEETQKEEAKAGVDKTTDVAIANTSTPLAPSNIDDFSSVANAVQQMEQMMQLAEVFVKGQLCPLKNPSDIVIAIITGNQIGLPYMTSIQNIFPINGKPAMSTHLIKALLLKGGVSFNKDYDCEPIYNYYKAEMVDGKLQAVKMQVGDKMVPILRGTAPLQEIDQTQFYVGNKPADTLTQYTFERQLKKPDGTFKDVKVTSRFKYSEAISAGLAEKDNWIKYTPRMMDARASMVGAREIASDIIFGMYSIGELADANNINYTISESLEENVIDAEFTVKE